MACVDCGCDCSQNHTGLCVRCWCRRRDAETALMHAAIDRVELLPDEQRAHWQAVDAHPAWKKHWWWPAPPSGRIPIPRRLRREVLDRDGLLCGICALPVDVTDIHIDHVIPVARGGATTFSNLRVTHSVCNLRKGVN